MHAIQINVSIQFVGLRYIIFYPNARYKKHSTQNM